MLITVSGVVGSGKTTVVKQIASLLEQDNETVQILRFQSLPCFRWLARGRRRAPAPLAQGAEMPERSVRWQGYRRRRLGAGAGLLYLARIVAFRAYKLSWSPGQWQVSNRYFYDLLVHYEPVGRSDRMWYGILRRFMPRPDLAILVTASSCTIAARRPGYSSEYIEEVLKGYEWLQTECPELVVISTDEDHAARERIRGLLASILNVRRERPFAATRERS